MIFLAVLLLVAALAIAICSAYFSIVGLTLLFVGSGSAIIVMGIALEIGKIITVSFLHQQWQQISRSLKIYLVLASITLIMITSIGIYGYLSAGYNATAVKVQGYEQQIESNLKRINELNSNISKLNADPLNQSEIDNLNITKAKNIEHQNQLIAQKELDIKSFRSNNLNDAKTSSELRDAKFALDDEKKTLEENTNKELDQIKLYNSRLEILDKEIQTWLNQGQGNLFKKNGIDRARETKVAQEKERALIDAQIKDCQRRIDLLRLEYKQQVDKYNERVKTIEAKNASYNLLNLQNIEALEKQVSEMNTELKFYTKASEDDVTSRILYKQQLLAKNKLAIAEESEQIQNILNENGKIKEQIIHTDVGTFKFVAKSVGLKLDQVVNYFIWAIMLVFDPLAVCLILAFNHVIKSISDKKKVKEIKIPDLEKLPISNLMTSTEIISGIKKPKPATTPVALAETQRLEKILETQRAERAARKAKQS